MTTTKKFRQNLGLADDLILGFPQEIQGQIADGKPMILVAVEITPKGEGEAVYIPRDRVREAWERSLT